MILSVPLDILYNPYPAVAMRMSPLLISRIVSILGVLPSGQ